MNHVFICFVFTLDQFMSHAPILHCRRIDLLTTLIFFLAVGLTAFTAVNDEVLAHLVCEEVLSSSEQAEQCCSVQTLSFYELIQVQFSFDLRGCLIKLFDETVSLS